MPQLLGLVNMFRMFNGSDPFPRDLALSSAKSIQGSGKRRLRTRCSHQLPIASDQNTNLPLPARLAWYIA